MAKNNKNSEVEKLKGEIERLKKELKKRKKYGLVWEEKPEEVVEMCKEKLPVLKEVKNKEIITDKDKPVNLLIEGDNYHALSVLNYTHAKKVDVIYIDPPYNTGNKDFIFNDRYVDREDAYRHSKWLAFMEKRLKLAKNLLKDTGVIFISIGEDEVTQLKLLMDSADLFGENNFIVNIARVSKKTSDKGTHFAPSKDYVLVYSRNSAILKPFNEVLDDSYKSRFKQTDKRGLYATVGLYQSALDPLRGCSNQRYYIKCPDGTFVIPPGKVMPSKIKDGAKVAPKTKNDKIWRWTADTYLRKKDYLVFKKTKKSPLITSDGRRADWNVYTKYYLEDRIEAGKRPRDFIDQFPNEQGTREIDALGLKEFFPYPKPVGLIKYLISISMTNRTNNVVLDFMAGSGTTAHAVLELNKEDGGNRQFILCTNNENNICTNVCYPRIKKIIEGYKNLKGERVEGLGGNLKYFKTDFVDYDEPTDKNKIKLTEQATEMLCVKEETFEKIVDQKSFKIFKNTNHYTGIIFDQAAIPAFKKAIKDIKSKFSVYVFSLSDETFDDEFKDIKQKVQLSPIPEAILRVYRRIFK